VNRREQVSSGFSWRFIERPRLFSAAAVEGVERKLRGKHLKKRHKCDVSCVYSEFRNETGRQQKVTDPLSLLPLLGF
jgi:hypothetical protein